MSPRNPMLSSTTGPTRRRFLAAVGCTAVVSTAGCSVSLPAGESGEGDTVEILVRNGTDETAHVGVRVEDEDGEALFSRVYELEPGHLDESAGVETRPATVLVFTPGGVSDSWEYAPDVDLDCEGEDIGITLAEDGTFESWYGC